MNSANRKRERGTASMNEATRAAIVAILKTDPDITPAHREAVLLTLDTWTEAGKAPDPEPMLSPTEAAARLHVTRRTLFRWIEAGTFNPVRYTARKIALRLSELTAFEQTGTRPAIGRPQEQKTRTPARPASNARLAAALTHARKKGRST